MKSWFYYTNPKRQKNNSAIKPLVKNNFTIKWPNMAIISMVRFPMIFLWFSFDVEPIQMRSYVDMKSKRIRSEVLRLRIDFMGFLTFFLRYAMPAKVFQRLGASELRKCQFVKDFAKLWSRAGVYFAWFWRCGARFPARRGFRLRGCGSGRRRNDFCMISKEFNRFWSKVWIEFETEVDKSRSNSNGFGKAWLNRIWIGEGKL